MEVSPQQLIDSVSFCFMKVSLEDWEQPEVEGFQELTVRVPREAYVEVTNLFRDSQVAEEVIEVCLRRLITMGLAVDIKRLAEEGR